MMPTSSRGHSVRYGSAVSCLVLALGIVAADALAQGPQSDPPTALQRYRLSAAQGDPAGLDGLGTLFERGSTVPVDLAKAYALYHLAASRQSAPPALVARATEHRDTLGSRMSAAQLARVNDLIALCNGSDVNRCGEIIIAAGAPSGTLASAQPGGVRVSGGGKETIALEPLNGVYVVPGVVNGVMSAKFLVDTGASLVGLPEGVVKSLVDSGFIAQSDFLGERTFRIANGSTIQAQALRLKSLQVGNVVVENVEASVLPDNAPLLLGQSFLTRLKSWSMDTTAHTLTIE
jgi:clan AA aspartic protease (TIGR02281 family)